MCRALRTSARYDTPDRNGETRRQRNARFKQESPSWEIPKGGEIIWEWFEDAGDLRGSSDGYPAKLSATEWLAWQQMTGNIVRPEEWQILRAMDTAYISALRSEFSDQMARESEKNRTKGRR